MQGQFKIQVMAFVLVAVLFLGVLVFLMFAQFQSRALSETARIVRERRTIAMLHTITALPEIGCSGLETAVCADTDKLEKFQHLETSYKRLWGSYIKKIIIQQVYPSDESKKYTIYDSGEGGIAYSTLIPLCKATLEGTKCQVGRIEIWIES